MNSKIVLISSGQPSLNPRLVKEADALAAAGYEVTVLYAYWNAWGTRFDETLLAGKPWRAIRVGGDPEQARLTYLLSRLLHKAARAVNRLSGGKGLAALAIARPSYFLIRAAKRQAAGLYIGHNSGALPATVRAARANHGACGFDAEDFHRFEVSDDPANADTRLKTQVENRYMPALDYLTAASPLIALAYRELFPAVRSATLHNVFPLDPRVARPAVNRNGALRLFWFSQTIGPNRGLETVIAALRRLSAYPFELHLLGQRQPGFLQAATDIPIHFLAPVAPEAIPLLAAQFDIGLAAEQRIPLNRDICLTNKIFTYIESGLAVAASDTTAQVKLLAEHPGIGAVYRQDDAGSLAAILLDYHLDREKLQQQRLAAWNLARQQLNWETEQAKLLMLVDQTLRNP